MPHLPAGANIIIESNSAIEFFEPDVVLYIADEAKADVKSSAAAVERRAHFRMNASADVPSEIIDVIRRKFSDRYSCTGLTRCIVYSDFQRNCIAR